MLLHVDAKRADFPSKIQRHRFCETMPVSTAGKLLSARDRRVPALAIEIRQP